jgi:hypothetical protein
MRSRCQIALGADRNFAALPRALGHGVATSDHLLAPCIRTALNPKVLDLLFQLFLLASPFLLAVY